MNYLKEIQILKTELSISLQKAKTLLEQTAGDISAAINLYHQENIATIMAETECERWEAESVYERFNYRWCFKKYDTTLDVPIIDIKES